MQICHSGFCLQKTGIYYLNHLLLIDSSLRGNDNKNKKNPCFCKLKLFLYINITKIF